MELAVVLVLLLLGLGGIVVIFCIVKQSNEETEIKIQEKQILENKKKFYTDCVKAGIKSLNSQEAREKAKLIAGRVGFSEGTDIDALFRETFDQAEREKVAEKKREIEALKQQEFSAYSELTRYSKFYGRAKRIQILTDMKDEYQKSVDKLASLQQYMWSGGGRLQKEQSWALQGGIASGLAGPAAGLAVALDVQNENAKIRAQNEAAIASIANDILAVSKLETEYKRKVEYYARELADAQIKLVAEIPQDELMKLLTVTLKKVEISKTGAFTVSVAVSCKQKVRAFENAKASAVIDGTITAELHQNGACVGSALLVLPTYGVSSKSCTVSGICLSGAKGGVPYDVTFKPFKLWAMEE